MKLEPLAPHGAALTPAADSSAGARLNRNGTGPGEQSRAPAAEAGSGPSRFERWLLRKILEGLGCPPVRLVFWNGEEIGASDRPPVGRLHVRNRHILRQLVLNPNIAFGDGYSSGELEIEGDMVALMAEVFRAMERASTHSLLNRWLYRSATTARSHSPAESKDNVHHHYDIGNSFYKLWLDEQLVYTCAYYAKPDFTLEQAQVAKMDHVCRKLWLSSGERVIEAGCGWGALALHIARHYGASVRAFNLSHEQIVYARDLARAQGLERQVEFIEDDYRNAGGQCDAFVSVGMLEHVGAENYESLGSLIRRVLTPSGRGLIHTIGRIRPRPLDPWTNRRIFPGAYPPSLREMMAIFEPNRLAVLDVENLRLHYARTLEHWLERFEKSADTVAQMFDQRFVRTWRMYLASSVAAFQTGCLQLFQVLFAPGENNDIPPTRDYIYQPSSPSG
jgi:cyclopropane-fatty-acyl-phospholipid synthase